MTAATPTGPASGPRPTSSTPATHRWPLAKASRSKSKWGVAGTGAAAEQPFSLRSSRRSPRITPFVGPQAIAAAAGRAKARNGNAGGKTRDSLASVHQTRIGYSGRMETPDPSSNASRPALAAVPGVVAVVLGGSRATGAAHASSDSDLGLYFSERAGLDVERLLEVVKGLVDDPAAAHESPRSAAGGRWIVGGGWLTIAGQKVDSPLSADRIGREGHRRLPRGPRQHGLSAGTSAWLLLGDLDGRSRALPAAQRS